MNKEDLYNNGDEEELRKKFQDRLIYRQKRTLKLLQPIEELFIEDVSKLAFKYRDDKTRLKLFSSETGLSCRDIEKGIFKKDKDRGT